MWKRAKRWVTRSATDPVPKVLTVTGCVVSALALVCGVAIDGKGFALNVAANVVLIGPALLLSNIIVKAIQDARAKRRVAPVLLTVTQTLHWAVRSAQQAFDMVGNEVSMDLPPEENEPFSAIDRVEAALADANTKLAALDAEQDTFCYLASHIAIRTDTASRIYYDRKPAQGKRHTQAVLALARRRLNVMWAMLRDHKPYQPTAPNAAAA
jgi:hypothetical protein